MGGFGDDPGLGAGHRNGRNPFGMEGHRQQGHGHLFTCGQQHVHLPLGRVGVDGGSESGEFIGGVPHRRHHDHQVVALVTAAADALGHGLDALDACHRGSAKLLNQQGHGNRSPKRSRGKAQLFTDAA